MARTAASDNKKKRIWQEEKAKCMALAIEFYHEEHAKPDGEPRLGLRKICLKAQKSFFAKTQVNVPVPNHNTLQNLATEKTIPKAEVNAARGWLSKEETEEVISYVIECAEQGFGLDHHRLKEHVDEICRARYGSKFPEKGVGINWTNRFVERFCNRLHMYTARSLHDVRGKAANPENNKKWYDLVEEIQLHGDNGKAIAPECTSAMDEVGFQANGDEGHIKVIGKKGKKVQYQQQAGDRNTITVLVTISADGTALPPAVLFAGKGYMVKWKQNNPANAMLGYSQKGWTDNEIGIEYAKHFESMTRVAARGRSRLLYVDGHRSHVTRGFLRFCKDHKIHVLCYPAHTTHIYQGLDVVIFSPMKQAFGRRRDRLFRETGEHISKENFLHVYGDVHLEVLQPELIKTAFRKTGIIPFNREVITAEKLAPSRDTSFRFFTPVEPPTNVRIMTEIMTDTLEPIIEAHDHEENDRNDKPMPAPLRRDTFPIRAGLHELSSLETDYLFQPSPIKSSSEPPDLPTVLISPVKRRVNQASQDHNTNLFTMTTSTPAEKSLQEALIAKESEVQFYKMQAIQLQSAMVLQRLYCNRVRRQLRAKEVKDAKKKNKKGGRIMGDGLPRLLTADEFVELVEAHEKAEEEAAREKQARSETNARYEAAIMEWERCEEIRKEQNKQLEVEYHTVIAAWKTGREEAKLAKKKLKDWERENPKPLWKDYNEKGTKRPQKKDFTDGGGVEEAAEEGWTDEE